MKRIQEKVKDIVEVRPFSSLHDLTADPALTLAGYHFTDSTAGLMAKWLDAIAEVRGGNGAAYALAGYRGVGKSHFLAALAAVTADPDLRSRIPDAHAATSAGRLLRRHYPVCFVRRGTFDSLREELQHSVGQSLKIEASSLGESAEEIFGMITKAYGDLPFVLIVDTALERGERVTRDDGGFLGELAAAAKRRNIFLGVALDDDIAGADGVNADIAKMFSIDFLDQEHLYKVVNAHVFPKHVHMQPVLHDVYGYFRQVLPDFRWSEQRFSSLYPLHPAILEVAPFVRLYVHDFALLGFAATAGERILGRPANSLIALDEVFDTAEEGLRKVDDLTDAFLGYDFVNAEVISKIPVMQRLQAKLILKGLLVLSLDGRGSTAGEICAGILIFEEEEPSKAVKNVEGLLQTFSETCPDYINTDTAENGELRYRFRVSSKDDLNRALASAADANDPAAINAQLRRLLEERFPDVDFSAEGEKDSNRSASSIVWRGGIRRGDIIWCTDAKALHRGSAGASDESGWSVIIDTQGDLPVPPAGEGDAAVIWKPDALRKDEVETIRRFHALNSSSDLREQFSDQIRASLHSHNLSVNRIFNRSFLDDGKLVIDGFDYNFTEEAKSAEKLSVALSMMLDPLFEARYPDHPKFSQKLDIAEVSSLVTDLYSGNRQYLAEVQRLANAFALPLGLVREQGGVLVPETEEQLLELPLAERILELVGAAGDTPVSLDAIYRELGKPPYGLVIEAQQLILSALVAARQVEFVTLKGDRINRRSLDLQIIWSDIVAIARPLDSNYSAKKLVLWGSAFAGASGFRSLDDLADREMLRTAFLNWTAEWRRRRILEKFESVPDPVLNTETWNLAARLQKTLGSVFENMTACLDGQISYEECLARIADAFLDQPDELTKCTDHLETLDNFVKGVAQRQQIEAYLALCEPTGVETLEIMRERLLELSDRSFVHPTDSNNRELGYVWDRFLREYTDHFAGEHDRVVISRGLADAVSQIVRGEDWWQFKNLSALPPCRAGDWGEIRRIESRVADMGCTNDVRASLKIRPFCTCSFSLSEKRDWEELPLLFGDALRRGVKACWRFLSERQREIRSELPRADALTVKAVEDWLASGSASLSPSEMQILRSACTSLGPNGERRGADNKHDLVPQPAGEPVLSEL